MRDDFWVAASRFMQDLEIVCSKAITVHCRSVRPSACAQGAGGFWPCLREVARYDGRSCPRNRSVFLKRAVEGLAQDGKIICVRLALFADMLKGMPWTTATLAGVGGAEGLGVTFLEETFSASTAPAAHRYHQQAARAVLQSLLPAPGSDIKGSRQSCEALLNASGYAQRPGEFEDLIRILDAEIRLITPAVPRAHNVDSHATSDLGATSPNAGEKPGEDPNQKYYQLTHDYLIPSLRDWLTRKQQETRAGRAELRLAERSASWNVRPEHRHLPSFVEFAQIRTLTRPKNWTEPQREMMRRASRFHSARIGLAVLLVATVGVAAFAIRREVVQQQKITQAEGLVNTLVNADTAQLPEIAEQVRENARWTEPLLRQRLKQYEDDSIEKLHIVLALPSRDAEQVEHLYARSVAR